MKIYLVGLGNREGDLSVKGLTLLKSGKKVIVRTALTTSYKNVENAEVKHISLDGIYEKSRNFESLNKNLASEILKAAKEEEIIYCVDGSANEDNSCKIILSKHKDTEIISAPSKTDGILELAGLNKNYYSSVSAYDLNGSFKLPLIVYDIDSAYAAGETKLKLSDFAGEDEDILYISKGNKKTIKLYELDRQENYDYSTAAVIFEKDLTEKKCFFYKKFKVNNQSSKNQRKGN